MMPSIRPISDLRNSASEISDYCRSTREPVFITRNGSGDMVVLNTDNPIYGGNGFNDDTVKHFTLPDPLYKKEKKEWMKLYLPARTAMVHKRKK